MSKYCIRWLLACATFLICCASHAGIDLYSGPLAMFYTNRWEDLAAKWAKENGVEYTIIRPTNQNNAKPMPDTQVLDIVRIWKDRLVKGFKEQKLDIQDWNESLNSEYNTIQVITKFYDYIDTYEEKTGKELKHLKLELWIPSTLIILFEFDNPEGGKRSQMGSIAGIIHEINELSEYYFSESIQTLSENLKNKSIHEDAKLKPNLDLRIQLSEIYGLCIWSSKKGLPMKLSY